MPDPTTLVAATPAVHHARAPLPTLALVPDGELARLRTWIETQLPAFLGDLERLVNIDCGSYTKAGVDEVGRWVTAALEQLGMDVRFVPDERLGDVVIGEAWGREDGPRGLLVGHMDTVFDPGTAAERPFRVEGSRAHGPGVTDMKAGLLCGIYALRAIRALAAGTASVGEWLPYQRLVFVANPDEEIGSPVSGGPIREEAAQSDVAFVLECARANGDIVSRRKGIVDLHLRIRGRAAHAGVEPEKGRSAILEAAHKIVALHALTGRWDGVTCNVGVAHGGTRPNVVAEEMELRVDLRAPTRAGLVEAEEAVRAIAATSTVPDVTCDVEEHGRHWPMERLPASERLVEHAVDVAARLGFPLRDAATGGASDANTTAGMGVPTLDGLGPIGGNDHAPTEYLEVDSIVPRVTLLAGLLLATARDPEVLAFRQERALP
jgi:glutamate carboxypeptidase